MNNSTTLVGQVVLKPVYKVIPTKDTTLAEFSIAVKDHAKRQKNEESTSMSKHSTVMSIASWNGSKKVVKSRGWTVAVENEIAKTCTQVIKYVVILNGFICVEVSSTTRKALCFEANVTDSPEQNEDQKSAA